MILTMQWQRRFWISHDLMYTPKEKGGVGFFNLTDFIAGLRITWVRRYGQGTSDHWCDILDQKLGLNEWNRQKTLENGRQHFLLHFNKQATWTKQNNDGLPKTG